MECVQLAGAFGLCWRSTAAASCAHSIRFARFGNPKLLEAGLLGAMDPDPYIPLIEALAAARLTGQRSLPDHLVVSAQRGPVWRTRGNSLWLSHRAGVWYLSTWLPVRYRVPTGQDIVALCCACTATGSSPMSRVPPEIVARFGLQEIDERQYEELFPTGGEGD
jgi:hypothetical protein